MTSQTCLNLHQPPEYHIQYTLQESKRYCILKYTEEQKFNNFRKPLDIELKDKLQDLMEEGLSPRKVNSCRVMFEKSLESKDVINPNEKPLSNKEKAERIFQFINDEFGIGNASNHFRTKYYESEELILNYYTRYYDIKDIISNAKKNYQIRVNELKNEIIDNGVPYALLQYMYSRFKIDIGNLKKGIIKQEVDYFDQMYNNIREELLQEVQDV